MSFWKRTILGSDKASSELPNSAATRTTNSIASENDESPPREPSPTEPSAAVGPPPIATAYTHPSSPKEGLQKPKTPPRQQEPPPTFHIFEPKPQTTASAADDEMLEAPNNIKDDLGNVDEGQRDEWDFDEPQEEQEPTDDVAEISYEKEMDAQDINSNDEDIFTPAPALYNDDNSSNGDISEEESATETELVHEQTAKDTPLSPQFDFLNESVPLQQLQDSTSKRRHESLSRIHELDCKLASLQAKLAHESMNRAKALNLSKQLNNIKPLEDLVERFGNQLLAPPDGNIHSRLGKLEATRMRHIHVELPDAVADELESPYDYVTQELQSSLRLERSKADKRIGSLVRRFETIAGTVARRHQEEAASRRAALVQVEALAQDAADLDEQRALQFLESLKELRQTLEQEKEQRKVRDKEVMELIVERTTELKRALLEAAGST